jgi:hypothetical protein
LGEGVPLPMTLTKYVMCDKLMLTNNMKIRRRRIVY